MNAAIADVNIPSPKVTARKTQAGAICYPNIQTVVLI